MSANSRFDWPNRSCKVEARVQDRLERMAGDADPLVRYQAAFSLGELPGTRSRRRRSPRWRSATGRTPGCAVAILSSVSGCAGEVFGQLAGNAPFRDATHGRAFLLTLAAQCGATGRPDDLAAVLNAVDRPPASDRTLSRDIVAASLSRMPAAALAKFREANAGKVEVILAGLLVDARKTAVDDKKPTTARAAAVRSLRFAPFDDVHALLSELLASRQPPEVQTAAIETLARFDDARVASLLLHGWSGMSPKLRATATEALFARTTWIGAFLDAVEKGNVGRADVDPARLDLLKSYPVAEVRERACQDFRERSARRQDRGR